MEAWTPRRRSFQLESFIEKENTYENTRHTFLRMLTQLTQFPQLIYIEHILLKWKACEEITLQST